MAITGIASARLKLERAQHHIEVVTADVVAFEQSDPWGVRAEWMADEETATEAIYAISVTKLEDPPTDLPAKVGDCFTNLRAALDHSVFDHACTTLGAKKGRALTEQERRGLFFPLARTHEGLRKSKSYLAPDVYTYVRGLHDFTNDWRSTDPSVRHLALLREFVNYDKHHAVIPGMADVHVTAKSSLGDIELIPDHVQYTSGTVQLGVPLLKLPFRKLREIEGIAEHDLLADLSVKFPLVLRLPNHTQDTNLHVGEPLTIPREPPLADTLRGMYNAVESVVDELRRLGV
ncbi:hypothetical protein [Nocardia coubleae]|uniref:Uncharacterized protein n=1 Tax=Nocardia coubleae TaxID=356147 RepID=A0A846WC86_9NOCA|nr:hypothetical protein [Nocardia coubleae]NKX90157.1 hypothetical protein [Nocardia coubleae]